MGWIAVDLDGTLAHYDHWRGIEHIGDPVPRMAERVRGWLMAGNDVRIFTARVGDARSEEEARRARSVIQDWCEQHFGVRLVVTATKDLSMVELWDDRCVQVEPNTGRRMDGRP